MSGITRIGSVGPCTLWNLSNTLRISTNTSWAPDTCRLENCLLANKSLYVSTHIFSLKPAPLRSNESRTLQILRSEAIKAMNTSKGARRRSHYMIPRDQSAKEVWGFWWRERKGKEGKGKGREEKVEKSSSLISLFLSFSIRFYYGDYGPCLDGLWNVY